jgi:hypothetical protein
LGDGKPPPSGSERSAFFLDAPFFLPSYSYHKLTTSQNQRALEKAQRELDRERIKLEGQEKKLIADIKRSAKAGQMGACKIQAKDLVRTRRFGASSPPLPTRISNLETIDISKNSHK